MRLSFWRLATLRGTRPRFAVLLSPIDSLTVQVLLGNAEAAAANWLAARCAMLPDGFVARYPLARDPRMLAVIFGKHASAKLTADLPDRIAAQSAARMAGNLAVAGSQYVYFRQL